MQKCRELNAEIVANSAKVSTALKLSQEDQNTITALKKVLINIYFYTCTEFTKYSIPCVILIILFY